MMHVPRGEPEVCKETGRICTEWFEEPEHTEEYIEKKILDKLGLEEKPDFGKPFNQLDAEARELFNKYSAQHASFKTRRWRHNMTQQEVQARMNEASKMISTDNFKYLSPEVQERTGLEVNPLWMLECLVRSGVLSPKDQISALKELAAYTHSKAPSLSHNTNMNVKPEDWLMELAKDEYEVLGKDVPMPNVYQPREKGTSAKFEKSRAQRLENHSAVASYKEKELEALFSEVPEDFDIEELNLDGYGE